MVLATGCGGGQLDAGGLSQDARSLQSAAAEGALLARDAGSGRTTRIYSGEHSADLRDAASRTAAALAAARTTASLEPMRRRLAVLARRVTSDLNRISAASEPEERALARRLEVAAQQIETLDQSIA